MTFKWLSRHFSSKIDKVCLCISNKCLFMIYKNESKKRYIEVSENFYHEILILVLSALISHYSCYIKWILILEVLYTLCEQLSQWHVLMFFFSYWNRTRIFEFRDWSARCDNVFKPACTGFFLKITYFCKYMKSSIIFRTYNMSSMRVWDKLFFLCTIDVSAVSLQICRFNP